MAVWRKPGLKITSVLWAIGAAALIALSLLIIRYSSLTTVYALYRAAALVHSSEAQARTTTGRMAGTPYAAFKSESSEADDLGHAELLLLNLPQSAKARYLEGLIDVGMKNWRGAAQKLSELVTNSPDSTTANDLGVVFLQLAKTDPIYLFKALDQFEQAEKRSPRAPEPHFNRLLILRQLHLTHLQQAEEDQYSKIESRGPWHDELLRTREIPSEQIAAQLQNAIDRNDDASILSIFNSSPEICREIAMRYGMNPIDAAESEKLATSVGAILTKDYGDETVSSMLSALRENRSTLVTVRRLVAEGANYYLKDNLKASEDAYDRAADALQGIDSPFDRLWLDLNRAITEVRLGDGDSAATTLDNVVKQARARKFKWVLASALSTYGSLRALNSSFSEMMDRLEEAVHICDEIAAPKASVRALYYMLGQMHSGGDMDATLQISLNCLRLLDPSDHLRVAAILTHLEVALYKKGFFDQAVTVGDEAVWQAVESHNPAIVGAASTSLAVVQEWTGQANAADRTLTIAEKAAQSVDGKEGMRFQIAIGNTRGRILLHRGKIAEAINSLSKSRDANEQNLTPSTVTKAETLTLLGQAYTRANRFQEARVALQEAVNVAEGDSNFARSESNRGAFDSERRELYESAIGFEYEQGSPDAAWTYLQEYRAKTFIEILAQFNPEIERIHSLALDRNQVQQAIPAGMQVVEYAMLPDRLLIWLVTNNKFETRSVAIQRADLEQKIQDFLADVRAAQPVIRGNADLYNVLIAPIAALLDRDRALAIIPDRALHGFPFAAIDCPENRYLIQYYPIIESPTLTHLLAVNEGKLERDSIVTFGSRSEDVAENREIGAIKTIYRKAEQFTGSQVTKTTFLDEMERARIFHYAGHSAHDAADPLRSSILLDGVKGGPNSVTAVDIVGHKLQPNALVILSSCDSSVGNSKDGIGIRGLTSAFLVSGAAAVVGSLWPVESTSTSELMITFHKAFASEHLPIAQALRKAQLALLEANPRRWHPYYWSGFVVTSNFSAIR